MEIREPLKKGFTIYSKSGCSNCTYVKRLIKDNHFLFFEINCDEYILENKDEFLTYIEDKAKISCKTFPMVFYDATFVGGLTQTTECINKLLLSFEDIF